MMLSHCDNFCSYLQNVSKTSFNISHSYLDVQIRVCEDSTFTLLKTEGTTFQSITVSLEISHLM